MNKVFCTNITQEAKKLGITRQGLHKRLKEWVEVTSSDGKVYLVNPKQMMPKPSNLNGD